MRENIPRKDIIIVWSFENLIALFSELPFVTDGNISNDLYNSNIALPEMKDTSNFISVAIYVVDLVIDSSKTHYFLEI